MKKTFSILMLASLITFGCNNQNNTETVTEESEPITLSPISESVKTAYTDAIECSADSIDLYRNWCAVTKIGEDDFLFPDTKTSYLGFSMIYDPEQTVVASSLDTSRFSVLHLDQDSALLTDITPSNDDEQQEILEVSLSLVDNLKNGFAGDFALSSDFYDYIMSEQAQEGYLLTLSDDGKSVTYEAGLPSELYYVPNKGYVAIEDNGDGRAYVSIFSLADLIKN